MIVESILKVKRPIAPNWQRAAWWQCPPQLAALGYPVEAWEHRKSGLFVLSAIEVARDRGPVSYTHLTLPTIYSV